PLFVSPIFPIYLPDLYISPRHAPPLLFFFFICTSSPLFYTLSLHDALPISFSQHFIHCRLNGSFFSYQFGYLFLRGFYLSVVPEDRKSTRLNSSHVSISYAVFCLKKKLHHFMIQFLNIIILRIIYRDFYFDS